VARQNIQGTSRKVKLTEALIKRAEPLPPQRPGEPPRKLLLLDTTTRGFACSVNAHSKSYVVIRRVHGKQVRYKFRRVNEVTLQEARTEAERLLVDMGSGVNPVEVKRAAVAAAAVRKARGITLAEAWALRQSMLKSKARSERTIATEKYLLEKYLADWMPRELASFTREDVRRKHAALTAEIARGRHKTDEWRRRKAGDGRATANNVMRSFRACWNRALRQTPDLGISPTANIDWHTIAPRKAPIGLDGLATLWQRFTAIESTARRDLWTLLLYTGLRKTSAIEMKWSDVNLNIGVLHIPKPKGGEARAFDLPLPTEAVWKRAAEVRACARPGSFPLSESGLNLGECFPSAYAFMNPISGCVPRMLIARFML